MLKASSVPGGEKLTFSSDRTLRNRFFVEDSFSHPAKIHLGLLQWVIDHYTEPGDTIADPMAGIGSICLAATMQRHVLAYDVEPRWVELMRQNATKIASLAGLFAGTITIGQADAREVWPYQADHIITSPPYGNSMNPQSWQTPNQIRKLERLAATSERWNSLLKNANLGSWGTMTFTYGSHENQIGHYRGERYWRAMTEIYTQAFAALRMHGFLIVVIKDHIYEGKRVPIAENTIAHCQRLGFSLYAHHQRLISHPALWTRRRKERGEPTVDEEDILVLRKHGSQAIRL